MVNAMMAGKGNSASWVKQQDACFRPFAEFGAWTRETEGEDGDFNPTHPPMMPAHELPSLDTSPDPSLRCSSLTLRARHCCLRRIDCLHGP